MRPTGAAPCDVLADYNHALGLLFSYRTDDIDAEFIHPAIESIRAAFGPRPAGPLLECLFTRFEQAEEFPFDSVHQVKMPRWHPGRDDLPGALRAWEDRMRPFIHTEQKGALIMRTLFTPHDRQDHHCSTEHGTSRPPSTR